jgi:hypothetical protein
MLSGELQDASCRLLASITDVRAINYRETSLVPKSTLQRNPALRVLWKPDVEKLSQSSAFTLNEYVERFQRYLPSEWAVVDVHAYLAAVKRNSLG